MRRTGVTYGQIDRVLRSRGFSRRLLTDEPPAYWYEHKKSGALISLPPFPETDKVLTYHLGAVQTTLDLYGIADPTTLADELQTAV